VDREAELALRLEPVGIEVVAGAAQIAEHVEEIVPHEMAEHEAVVQRRAPADEPARLRLAPEPGGQRAQQQLLREAHLGLGRHFEPAKLDEAETAGRAIGREELVDADFGAVRVARHIDQQVAEQPIDQPRLRLFGRPVGERIGHLRQCDFQLVQPVVPCLVDPRRLAGRADEQAREKVGERRMALPVEREALEHDRAAG
jgi:hypothetical protein